MPAQSLGSNPVRAEALGDLIVSDAARRHRLDGVLVCLGRFMDGLPPAFFFLGTRSELVVGIIENLRLEYQLRGSVVNRQNKSGRAPKGF